jgi:SAM-dependent methyltransferase
VSSDQQHALDRWRVRGGGVTWLPFSLEVTAMPSLAERVMRGFYLRADGDPERLPWYRATPGENLIAAVRARDGAGSALDIGCGAGLHSTWMAKRGLRVTGLDLFPEAIEMARVQAERDEVQLDLVCGDLFSYDPEERFDLVFDSGCLHSLVGGNVTAYRQKVLRWLAPGGDYVLDHWGKRNALDWWPIGPRRRSQNAIERLFAPELRLVETEVVEFPVPKPFGRKVRAVGYWFERTDGK